jgi:hypothetical protein
MGKTRQGPSSRSWPASKGANDREQLIEDLTDLMKGGKLDVTGCNGV